MKRAEILEKAKACVTGSREQDYGSPEDNFKVIAGLWSLYAGCEIKSKDVAVMLALMKIARIKSGNAKEDNWIDLAGYAACGGEIEGGHEKDEPKKITNAEKYKEEIEAIGIANLAMDKESNRLCSCWGKVKCDSCKIDCEHNGKDHTTAVMKWLEQEAE